MPVSLLAFLAVPWLPWRDRARELAALYLWFLGLFFFYLYYEISQQAWWYLRFILPGIPASVLLAIWGLERAIPRFAHSLSGSASFRAVAFIATKPPLRAASRR